MGTYDYRQYFQTIISLLEDVISRLDSILGRLDSILDFLPFYSSYFDIIIRALTIIVVCKLFLIFGQVYRGR